MPATLVVLCGNARPVIDGAAQPRMTSLTSDDSAAFAAAFGHRGDAGQGPKGVIVSSAQRLTRLGEQRGEDDPSDTRQGSQDRHVALLAVLPCGIVLFILGKPVTKRVKTLVRLLDLTVHQLETLGDSADVALAASAVPGATVRGFCRNSA